MKPLVTDTVLFTDVVASTDLRVRQGDVTAYEVLDQLQETIRRQVAAHGGREIKTIGDSLMVVFSSAHQAVECAVRIQRQLARRRATPRAAAAVRIGIHTGDAIDEGSDFAGAAVVAASRIMGKARGEEILVSEMVRGVVGATGAFRMSERGRFALKGFPNRWRLYEVQWQEKDGAEGGRRTYGLMATDMRGSTETTVLLGEDGAFALMRSHNAMVRAASTAHGGWVVTSLGDGFLVAFEDPQEAVTCAGAVQRAFAEYRRQAGVDPIHVSVAVHFGQCFEEAEDLYGINVHLVFRVLDHAEPDEVLVTDVLRMLSKDQVVFGPPKSLALKGLPSPQTVYTLDW